MPVTDITKDVDARTLTITAQYAAPVRRLWDLYADPRQLEQVWGPPSYPATFVEHTLAPGARSTYYMTSPEGEKFYGFWEISSVSEPTGFAFDDGFADAQFAPQPGMPVAGNTVRFEPADGGTQVTWTSRYTTAEDMHKVLDMGMEEGARQAMGQIDALLAAGA